MALLSPSKTPLDYREDDVNRGAGTCCMRLWPKFRLPHVAEQNVEVPRPGRVDGQRRRCYERMALAAVVVGLAAFVARELLTRREMHRQKLTGAVVATAGLALSSYAADGKKLPILPPGPLARLRRMLEPAYIRELPTVDRWGNPLMVALDASGYVVWSRGRDGKPDQRWVHGGTDDPNADLVYANGAFRQFPVRGASVIFNPGPWTFGPAEQIPPSTGTARVEATVT
jgi:hypothetical protein